IPDREHRFEHSLKPLVRAAARRVLHHQKLVIGCLLNLDEVRHLCDFLDFSEKFSYALATRNRLRHVLSLCSSGSVRSATGTTLQKAAIIATIWTTVPTPLLSKDSARPDRLIQPLPLYGKDGDSGA